MTSKATGHHRPELCALLASPAAGAQRFLQRGDGTASRRFPRAGGEAESSVRVSTRSSAQARSQPQDTLVSDRRDNARSVHAHTD